MIKFLVWCLSWLYMFTLRIIQDVFFNGYWLIRHCNKIGKARRKKKEVIDGIKNGGMEYVKNTYCAFRYQFDGLIDGKGQFNEDERLITRIPVWIPLVIVFFLEWIVYNKPMDNCDGACVFSRWLLRKYKKYHKNDYIYQTKSGATNGVQGKHIKYKKVIYNAYDKSGLWQFLYTLFDYNHFYTDVIYKKDKEIVHREQWSSGEIANETPNQLAKRYNPEGFDWVFVRRGFKE